MGVRMNVFGEPCGYAVELNGTKPGFGAHGFGHMAFEVQGAARRVKNAAHGYAQTLNGAPHWADDPAMCVVRIQNGTASLIVFCAGELAVRKILTKGILYFCDVLGSIWAVTEEVRVDATPAGVFGHNGPFGFCGFATLALNFKEGFQGRKVVIHALGASLAFMVVTFGEAKAGYAAEIWVSLSPSSVITCSIAAICAWFAATIDAIGSACFRSG